MDTPHHTPQPEAERPPAEVQAGNPAERPAGTVSAEWNMGVEEMLNKPGFAGFLERYEDADSFEVSEDNKAEIASRYRAFEASKTITRQFEVIMNAKLRGEGKEILKTGERQAYREHVTELAMNDPAQLVELQNDLIALEAIPRKIEEREKELADLRANWNVQKIQTGLSELQRKKSVVESALANAEKRKFSLLSNFAALAGAGKKAEHKEQVVQWKKDLAAVTATIAEANEALISAPEMLKETEEKVLEARRRLESAQDAVFVENKAAKMIRERLISEAHKRCDTSLESTDIGALQKAAQAFLHDEKLAEKGSDYLGLDEDPGFADEYKKKLSEQMEKAVSSGILKALEALPADATQSRLERALRKFIALSEEGLGFADKETSRELVHNILKDAEQNARKKAKGSGKSILLKHLIAKLAKSSATRA